MTGEELKYASWQMAGGTKIVSPEGARATARKIRHIFSHFDESKPAKIILTSGGYDPIHPGHLSVFSDARGKCAKELGQEYAYATLIAIVNDDGFLERKKGRAFMPLELRCKIVSMINGVDLTVPFVPSDPLDMTVCEALEIIKPDVFVKGGDRTDKTNIPEWDICEANGIKIVTGVGDDKQWSSSDLLAEHEKYIVEKAAKKWLDLKNLD